MWKVFSMKEIKQVKLGFNKKAEVTVIADIDMKSDDDIDSLFLCFFTILSTEQLLTFGEEQNKINLESAANAKQASAILTSMLQNGFYVQKTRYHFPTKQTQKQEQKVDISQLKPAFKAMLEICKKWDDPKLLEELA